jgi:TIR domain/Pentapeptide repeats (8 copies)
MPVRTRKCILSCAKVIHSIRRLLYWYSMAKPEHVTLIKEGVCKWNEWRDHNPSEVPELGDGDFTRVDLRGANLRNAYLRGADFTGAYLSGADLSGATLWNTIFADTNLSETKGLDSCNHQGPSNISIDTFFRSIGKIPDGFLRGCGVPERFIAYARSMVVQPIEFYSCFISYSSHDQAFAERLNTDLRTRDLRCWFAPEDLKIGDHFQEQIEESIRVFDKVMIVLSKASVESRWVEREVNAAREREDRENRTILFPIRIDDVVMNAPQAWAADIRRSRHIGDFRGWKDHDSYAKAFERLLRDLQAKGPEPDKPPAMAKRKNPGTGNKLAVVVSDSDDEPAAKFIAEHFGYKVFAPRKPSIEAIAIKLPDLILIDWSPGTIKVNSRLVERIRSTAATRDVPVFVLCSDEHDVLEAILSVDRLYMLKVPFPLSVFERALRRALAVGGSMG